MFKKAGVIEAFKAVCSLFSQSSERNLDLPPLAIELEIQKITGGRFAPIPSDLPIVKEDAGFTIQRRRRCQDSSYNRTIR